MKKQGSNRISNCQMNLKILRLVLISLSFRLQETIRSYKNHRIWPNLIKVSYLNPFSTSIIGQWYLLLISIWTKKEIIVLLLLSTLNLISPRADSVMAYSKGQEKTIPQTDCFVTFILQWKRTYLELNRRPYIFSFAIADYSLASGTWVSFSDFIASKRAVTAAAIHFTVMGGIPK